MATGEKIHFMLCRKTNIEFLLSNRMTNRGVAETKSNYFNMPVFRELISLMKNF